MGAGRSEALGLGCDSSVRESSVACCSVVPCPFVSFLRDVFFVVVNGLILRHRSHFFVLDVKVANLSKDWASGSEIASLDDFLGSRIDRRCPIFCWIAVSNTGPVLIFTSLSRKAFCALLHAIDPSSIDYPSLEWSKESAQKNMQLAFDIGAGSFLNISFVCFFEFSPFFSI